MRVGIYFKWLGALYSTIFNMGSKSSDIGSTQSSLI